MAFSDFKLPADALIRFKLRTRKSDLFERAKPQHTPEYILESLKVAAAFQKMANSEMYLREFYIAPILGYLVSRRLRLNLYSDEYAFDLDDGLTGLADYLITWKKSADSFDDPDQRPLLAAAEAKKMDFSAGWAQCLAQLVAAQRVNENPETPVWGLVTTGKLWEFAVLQHDELVFHDTSLNLDPLEHLIAALSHVLDQCEINGAAFEAKQ